MRASSQTHEARPGGGFCPLRLACWLVASWVLAPQAGWSQLAETNASPQAGIFADVAAEVGLNFVHFNGMSGEYYFPEMTGQGGALVDYDNDGDLDVYLVQGAVLGPGKTLDHALFPPQDDGPLGDRLYRNDLLGGTEGGRGLRFVDVTTTHGLVAKGYGMGVAAGDYNNDGWVDLYLTNYGPNQMLRNDGGKGFTDVTGETGTGTSDWSTGAAFFDLDRDGWLDLYVVNYVAFSVEKNPRCYAQSSRRDYCGPAAFPPQSDVLFHNQGDGTFKPISTQSRIAQEAAAGLGVVATDLNDDGWIDVYVANDGMANQLWINQRDGTFQDEALLAGVALNREGRPEASMGVDAADFDGDGDPDLFMTHLTAETNTLYVNAGGGLFEDRTLESGLAAASLPYTSFGTGWLDYDNDGWLDLFVANGAVKVLDPLARSGDLYPLDQPNQLFRNVAAPATDKAGGPSQPLGLRRFEEVTEGAGAAFQVPEVSRGTAFGDVDNDGDTDVLVLNNNGPLRLLVNQVGNRQAWLGLRLVDREARRDMLGARVALRRPNRPPLWRRVATDGSYGSAQDPRVLFGLGEGDGVTAVQVHWPDGQVEEWQAPPLRAYTTLRQGSGSPKKQDPSAPAGPPG